MVATTLVDPLDVACHTGSMIGGEYQDTTPPTPDGRNFIVHKLRHVFAPSEATEKFITDHFEEGTAPRTRIVGSKTLAIPGELFYGNGLEILPDWYSPEKQLTVHEKITKAREAFQRAGVVHLAAEGRMRAADGRIRFAFKAAQQAEFDTLLAGIDSVVSSPDINRAAGHYLIAEVAAGGILVSRKKRQEVYQEFSEKMADDRARVFYVTPTDIRGYDERVTFSVPREAEGGGLPRAS